MPEKAPGGGPLVAALPMYDWPEVRAASDTWWARCRDALRDAGVPAPEALARRNDGMPPVPGGIRGDGGRPICPDPASLPGDRLDVAVLWRHPALLLAQTCWGPLEAGLAPHVTVLAQPDYSPFRGGHGTGYRSALVMRGEPAVDVAPPPDPAASLPIPALRGLRFACNGPESMSGAIALQRDLAAAGVDPGDEGFGPFWGQFWTPTFITGTHRRSIAAVAAGEADVAAIDCRSLDLARRHEPAAARVRVVGWTRLSPGLPLVASRHLPATAVGALRRVLVGFPDLEVVPGA